MNMSHEIKYLTFDAKRSPNLIDAEIQHYVKARTVEEGGHGLIDPIRWIDRTFPSYDAAYRYIQSIDNSYSQIAVKYREYPQVEKTAAMKKIEDSIESEIKKKANYAKENSISNKKAEFIGCPKCGSRLKRTLIRGESCVLCGTDLRCKTTLDTLQAYTQKIEGLRKKLDEEKDKQRMKLVKQSTEMWLVKIEYHV